MLLKYFYRSLFSILLFFTTKATFSQENLVLNPSFEDVNRANLECFAYSLPEDFDQTITSWTSPSKASPDIMHMDIPITCRLHPISIDPQAEGNRRPRSGKSMVGIIAFLPSNNNYIYREYIQGQLSSPLSQGETYIIKFYISLSQTSKLATNNIGIKFFDQSFYQPNGLPILITPDANYTQVINNSQSWRLIELEFTPQTSGLTHFVIGNFLSDAETTVRQTNSPILNNTKSYFFIDDVSVFSKTPTFDSLGPYCKGAEFSLPETSKNGYTGTWSPAINNQETTTYTFTPTDPKINSSSITIEILEPYLVPTFNIESLICEGTTISFPEKSQNGYSGTWSPAFDNQNTTTYTFTPEEGLCIKETTLTIEVKKSIKPKFNLPSFLCIGTDFTLPEQSENGILGYWTPAFNNTATTTYTFHPTSMENCITSATAKINIKTPQDLPLRYYCYKNQLHLEIVDPNQTIKSVLSWQINDINIEENTTKINLDTYRSMLKQNNNKIKVNFIDQNGCISDSNILLDEIQNICFIPRGISPQGDGLNDFFDLSHFGEVSLQIFNRFGIKVYDKNKYSIQWKGQSNQGNKLPSGTYFYHFTTSKGEIMTGWIQLLY